MVALFYASDISYIELTPLEYDEFIRSPFLDEQIAGDDPITAVVIIGEATEIASPGALPLVVCWMGAELGGIGPPNADVVLGADDVDEVTASILRAPIAAATLAVLLRSQHDLSVEHGLAAESAAYSVLQSGPEFATWHAAATTAPATETGSVVEVTRRADELIVRLDRPHRHNAISTQLRNELHAALTIAIVDDSIASVVLCGNGPSFCSGGDLGEFGSRSDPATAHVTRLACSPARLVNQLGERTTAYIHGSTLGGGIEIAAFASRLIAHPDTSIGLPEIGLGLIPGAGGTVSVSRRIGRQRAAALALTGRMIDAETALAWGLVDAIAENAV